jgi:hypothetical protein
MSSFEFDYLSGKINIPVHAPENWREEGLSSFYHDPNNPEWGSTLCRVLYHESLHFWQFLASGYLANLVAEEWQRLFKFRQTGEIGDLSPEVIAYRNKSENRPFSAAELVECVARYWDVHTRSPAKIIEEEKIEVENPNLLIRKSASGQINYTDLAFDTVMQKGLDCESYAAPYRWMLSQTAHTSVFVAVVFPLIAHFAFGSPDPVGVFCDVFEMAWKNQEYNQVVKRTVTGNINVNWVQLWPFIQGIVNAELLRRKLPSFTSGLTVIERGSLRNHSIYREYLIKAQGIAGHLKMIMSSGKKPEDFASTDEIESRYLLELASKDPWLVFGLPGQPIFRFLLGFHVPPPSVEFENYCYYSKRPAIIRADEIRRGAKTAESYEMQSQALCDFVREFRAAEYAVSLGQDPKSFMEK